MFFLMIRNRVLWECGKDCWTECSLVCSSADSSSDSCFWFSNILHSDLQLLICHETEVAMQIRTWVIIDYWLKFCVSANIIIVGIRSGPATIKHCSNNRDSKKKVKYSQDQLPLNIAAIIGIQRRKLSILADTTKREEKKWNKTGTSACGSFVAAYFHPATSIDRLHLVLTSRTGSREAE